MIRRFLAMAALFSAVGCEQSQQALPLDPTDSVTRAIGTQGGSISTPAGVAVHFQEGSLPSGAQVTVSVTPVPTAALRAGSPASKAFRVEPEGRTLVKAAETELKFTPSTDPSRAWLASVVSVVNGKVREHGNSRVDLAIGVVSTRITQLGTVAAVIPPISAIFPVTVRTNRVLRSEPLSGALIDGDSVVARCGDPDNRCTGLSVSATSNLLDQVQDAAVIYPLVEGAFRVSGATVTGSITADATMRIKLQSGRTAESVVVRGILEPTAATVATETATELRFTAVRHRISGSTDGESAVQEQITTLVVPKNGSNGSITIDRTFDVRTLGGGIEPARITLTFPVAIHR